jgi:hypothetical protein
VVLDSETIQQYMRIKGYTASSVMGNQEQLSEIAKYMSPAVVYEAAHKSQADWAASRGVYMPRTQENEIEAMALEGLFTTEKMRKDPEFGRIMTSSRDFSTYASKRLDVGTEFEMNGSKKFANTVRQRYYAGRRQRRAGAPRLDERRGPDRHRLHRPEPGRDDGNVPRRAGLLGGRDTDPRSC